jgi:hypothetical protein
VLQFRRVGDHGRSHGCIIRGRALEKPDPAPDEATSRACAREAKRDQD